MCHAPPKMLYFEMKKSELSSSNDFGGTSPNTTLPDRHILLHWHHSEQMMHDHGPQKDVMASPTGLCLSGDTPSLSFPPRGSYLRLRGKTVRGRSARYRMLISCSRLKRCYADQSIIQDRSIDLREEAVAPNPLLTSLCYIIDALGPQGSRKFISSAAATGISG